MNRIFFLLFLLLIISVNSQKKQQKKPNSNDKNKDKPNVNAENLPKQDKENSQVEIETITQKKVEEKPDLSKYKLEKEEFEKKIEVFTIGDFTTIELPSKSAEIIYYKIDKPCLFQFAFYLSKSEKLIHMIFSGPDGKGGSKEYQNFKNKNFLYSEFNATNPGQYTFYLNNQDNPDKTEISFAIKNNLKVDKNIDRSKLDSITEYLEEMDEKFDKMRTRQSIANKKTDAYNDSVNTHNKSILINSIVEVTIMILIIIAQLYYIKNKIDKI